MKTILTALFMLGSAQSLSAQPSRSALARDDWAITNVTVIPMTGETVIPDATVRVRNGRIEAVGPSQSVRLPSGIRTVDGRGRFLIPGLADMHTHLFSDGEIPDSLAPVELGVMLANGLTAVRLMIGTPQHLELRREIESGRVAGPQLWVASPQFTGRADENSRQVTTPDNARAAVREVAEAGYDFIKLTLDVSPEVYEAIVTEAAAKRIPLVGHVDPRVGARRALAAGQHIEHLDNYLESVLADSSPTRNSVSDRGLFQPKAWESLAYLDAKKIAEIAGMTARSGTWTSATLHVFHTAFALGQTEEAIRARPDWKMMPPKLRTGYLRARERYWGNPPEERFRKIYVDTRNGMVKAIADSGGNIMAGSDSPEWFLGYGFTLHRELEALVAAGLTPYQALAAATTGPARFLKASAEWGTISVGKRADLVLLSGNPLADIRNTSRIEGVAVGGRWIERGALDRMIQAANALGEEP
jgi:imidazolonepropionase-like amidohydrolase